MSDNIIQKHIVKIGINNDRKIIVDFNFEMFNNIEDIEPLLLVSGILNRMQGKINDQILDIENGDVEPDELDIDDFISGLENDDDALN